MLQGLTSLLWLKGRHARSAIVRAGYYAATDILRDRGVFDRLYQLYLALILMGLILVSWVALLDAIVDTCALMGPELVPLALPPMLFLPLSAIVLLGITHMRTPPLKLTLPDIAYLASSPVSTATMALAGAAASALIAGAVGFLLGYVGGTGLQSALGSSMAPWSLAPSIAFGMSAAALGAWAVGLGRLALQRPGRTIYALVATPALCLLAVLGAWAMGNAVKSGAITVSSLEAFMPTLCVIGALVTIGLLAIVAAVARRVDMTLVIEKNALYAELYPLRFMMTSDAATYHDIRRRKRVALRGPVIFLPIAEGRGALASRALLSHLRQFDGLPSMVVWSALIVPAGIALLLRPTEPGLLLAWMATSIAFARGGKEVTRVFRDDRRNRLIGDHLPFDTLGLLVLDSLPALVLSVGSSTLVAAFMLSSELGSVWMVPVAIVFNLAVMLCGGLDAVSSPVGRWQPSYDVGWFVFVVAMALLSLAGSPLLLLLGGVAALGVFAGIVRMDS